MSRTKIKTDGNSGYVKYNKYIRWDDSISKSNVNKIG